tara:strand:- start:396 stop:650 length:255 start_codon:yes stop_codon:yes gene_type:complete
MSKGSKSRISNQKNFNEGWNRIWKREDKMSDKEFIKEVFELACGDGAICVENNDNEVKAREFTKEEVLDQIREYIDHALKWEER